jgi:hypothetical protein
MSDSTETGAPRATYASLYDSDYFAEGCGIPYGRNQHWLDFFGKIADRIITEMQPQSVLDAGCAMGILVESLRDRGVEAYGVDISEYAIEQARADIRPYCHVASLTAPLPRRYDLIVCIEVLEHMPQAESEQAIVQICAATDDVLVSTTPLDYKEATHFNVQPPEYWAAHFGRQGFVRDVDFDAGFITPWAVRYRRTREPLYRVAADYERRLWPLLKENVDLRAGLLELRERMSDQAKHVGWLEAELQDRNYTCASLENDLRDARRDNQFFKDQFDGVVQDPSWQFLQKLHSIRVRLAPENSRREAWFRRLLTLLAR